MKVVIIAGGQGTRIASINNEIPKAMIPVEGKPVIEYQVELAKRYGFDEFIFIVGYLGNIIEDYFSDGSKWGVSIEYYKEESPLGTAGALPFIKEKLKDDFFVFYGDTIMDVDLIQMLEFHKNRHADASLFLHPNDHPYDSDLVAINENAKVTEFFTRPYPEGFVSKNLVNAALYILSPNIIRYIPINKKSDFGKHIFPTCLNSELNLYGYVSAEYIKDMGTPDRYEKVSEDVRSGKVAGMNNNYPKRAIFLDRDGVITEEVDLLSNPSQLNIIEGAAEAIKLINRSGYLAVIITNQPVIARNLCSIEELNEIHNTLETVLGFERCYVDAIYYCPHHPDRGYPEERREYKIECECRKPKPGMILNAAKDWNVDLSKSYMIGDRKSDIDAGNNAGLKNSFLIKQNCDNALLEIVKKIIKDDNIPNTI